MLREVLIVSKDHLPTYMHSVCHATMVSMMPTRRMMKLVMLLMEGKVDILVVGRPQPISWAH